MTDKAGIAPSPHINPDGFFAWGVPARRLWAVHGDATSVEYSILQRLKGSFLKAFEISFFEIGESCMRIIY